MSKTRVQGEYVMTIESDDDVSLSDADEEEADIPAPTAGKKVAKPRKAEVGEELNKDFAFDITGGGFLGLADPWDLPVDLEEGVRTGSKPQPISVDDIIERRRLRAAGGLGKRKREEEEAEEDGEDDEDEDEGDEGEEDDEDDEDADDDDGDEEEEGFGLGAQEVDEEDQEDPLASDEEVDEEQANADPAEDDDDDNASVASSSASSISETAEEQSRKAAFFDTPADPTSSTTATFQSMNLSRPLLKALSNLGFDTPTPIQAATIPVALLGKDVVGGAVTGSGKTAAFMIPILERLLFRDRGKSAAATRVVILCPTRELAVQCHAVATRLGSFTDVRFCLVVGGLSLKPQEAELRSRPDVVIATPGRLIDHLRNSPSFSLDMLDVLIMDEADRMLEEGFAAELSEIISACPRERQTMLFSATMTDSVDELIRAGMSRPVRLFVDPRKSTASGLTQEFVRVREGKQEEDRRAAILMTLCKRNFRQRCIIFFRSKAFAHQMRIVFGLLGMKAGELHGNLTQDQRLRALQQFKDGEVDFLLATDLASRGLDIRGIETVINYDMPGQMAQYLHRVGRTARAGLKGRSVTLVGEADRKMLKAVIKHSPAEQVKHRLVPPEAVAKMAAKLKSLKEEVDAVLKEEREEKALRQAEMELKKGENMIEHQEEIFARPARTWFQTEKEKKSAQENSKEQYVGGFATNVKDKKTEERGPGPKRDKFSGLSRKAKRRKLAQEEDEGSKHSDAAAIRSAKKSSRPTKIGMPEPRKSVKPGKKDKKKEKKPAKSAFDRDLTEKGRREGMRTTSKDKVGLSGKTGKKAGGGKGSKLGKRKR